MTFGFDAANATVAAIGKSSNGHIAESDHNGSCEIQSRADLHWPALRWTIVI